MVLARLAEYVTAYEAPLRAVFEQIAGGPDASVDASGLAQLVSVIPGLIPAERAFLQEFLYKTDPNGDGCLTWKEFKAIVAARAPRQPAAGVKQ